MSTHAYAAPSVFSRAHGHLAALVSRPWFWVLFVLLAGGIPIVRAVRVELPPPLPVLATVPRFQLTDQHGQTFDAQQLQGKVWVANFIFTRCPTICPLFTQQMGTIQHRGRNLGQYFHLVSFTVDPEHDTPEKLLAYAQTHRVSPRMWSFLTGSYEALKAVIVDGMKVHMQKGVDPDDLMSIGHGSHFVLVDAKMQVRGYYQFNDPGAVDKLLRDAGLLAMRGY
ncbi:MAG: SCO family protein [Myxococcota bacterium]